VEQISITRDKTDYFWYLTEWVILENSWQHFGYYLSSCLKGRTHGWFCLWI
jgi:hypothetical protein